ncbi:TetR/AcrR family transcriptional regulator [Streptomyces sp. NBC_00053]|uniref:TetR/AcrR family transcriptional regulator n=1 Tax=unclassified Streptomyces TaxID=2593676 RepID=UPI000FAB39B2|nr:MULTISPECIES: TetR/AcrR family transcriptional regulator [unclassified Streptomyces]WSG48733.1 TetR/AcrR family transcriptional regulator [Streptomyces sp. NBC_01732]WSW99383.1 TetR/AcrR family transcriptional regulator [Streptomyces sp. NBC_00987]MCX4399164.1 TetR/AcrR family transcriptional regulator [Streptomyces sp. NBC_01767]MCX5098422.1 TetR/AcrR family transcriptional regulator [Streptomyces sp. NBC_00439]MCX5157845.1 TetR/AcrR family transcriptional regulator [Streptomyces sp. NBC_0
MRADAARSRRRILDAAREVFLERGLDAPLDLIVRRAGVGPATLYRRYPDREALVRDLTGDLLSQLESAAKSAAAVDDDAFAAVRRFVHAAADLRMGAAILVLLEGLVVDQELVLIRTRAANTVETLIQAAHEAGQLRRDVGMGDLVLLSIRLSRPLPGGLDRLDPDGALLHRHLDLALDGLTAVPSNRPAATTGPGVPLTFAELITAADRPTAAR